MISGQCFWISRLKERIVAECRQSKVTVTTPAPSVTQPAKPPQGGTAVQLPAFSVTRRVGRPLKILRETCVIEAFYTQPRCDFV